ncbi:Cobalamin B12-binding:Radical SAM [Desulfamplus magnetovallimortis]|uniref:Cobalamin B12-binding:Radical SAM n=1 Tax=Desulfamplus magnetovallimortis TaxID=1246637 RepID=L0R400_9BACT|nr:radical SAM protein [Desulfamplus magnetovallimortis]CCO06748.1 Cobalamin B12-binding:Radical SAM [Desulfamplus magnetovallimortis BW-1]SLM32799.1 Cobalamin B12-binding:Radical SAM [Desulfamplus magnetovallimortis]
MQKKLLPEIKTVFGGAHVSALKQEILNYSDHVDFVVAGEGEETFLNLIKAQSRDIPLVKGLVYRDSNGNACFSGMPGKQIELDQLPFPAYEKLAGYPEIYRLPIFNYPSTPNASCISSRGCPYACSYCDRSVFGRTFRFNSAEYLFEHVKYLKDRFNIRHINFYDDQFTFHRKRIIKFCDYMIASGMKMTFNCAARAEHLDSELLGKMKEAGCWMISLGIETGDESLLAMHRQNADLNMLSCKVHMIKKAGIRVKGLLMIGLPGETESSIKKSREYVFSLPLDDFNLAKFTPFPGSPIYKEIKAGKLHGSFEENWEKMDCMSFTFVPQGMNKERLDELFTFFYKSHFLRPKVMAGYLSMLWKSPDSWRRFGSNLHSFLSFARTNRRVQ